MAKTQNNTFDSEISNAGQLISYLQKYPADEPLHDLNHDFLRALSRKLRRTLERSSSELNNDKIRAIQEIHVDNELQRYSECWRRNPVEFWELSFEALPKYSDLQGRHERLRAFLCGALKLNVQLKIRRIHYRFVTIIAYKHFRRVFPTGKITEDKVHSYLRELDLVLSESDFRRFMEILSGGQRRNQFCQILQASALEDSNSPNAGANDKTCSAKIEKDVDYGPMFIDEIPDAIWDKKNGIHENQLRASVNHLRAVIGKWSAKSCWGALATTLLAFHYHLIWPESESISHKGKRHGKLLEKEVTKRRQGSILFNNVIPRTAPSESCVGMLNEERSRPTNSSVPGQSRWDCLVSVAKLQTTQTGNTKGDGAQPGIVLANADSRSWSEEQAQSHRTLVTEQAKGDFPTLATLHGTTLWDFDAGNEDRLGPPSSTMPSGVEEQSELPARSADINIHAEAATQQGEIALDCEQLSLSNVLNSGCLETLWSHNATSSAADALLPGCQVFSSEQETLPYLTSNDLDIFWHDNSIVSPTYS